MDGKPPQMAPRVGGWSLTFTGVQFYPLDALPGDVRVEDVAHALSLCCRYAGHCRRFYSVGHHSVLVCRLLLAAGMDRRTCLKGLLHDATEAFIGDMVRPLKREQPDFVAVEDRLWMVICRRFGLRDDMPPVIKWADNTILMTERRDLCIESEHKWSLQDEFPPVEEWIVPWFPLLAERRFLELFYEFADVHGEHAPESFQAWRWWPRRLMEVLSDSIALVRGVGA